MATPLPTGKRTVDLAAAPRVSRIRRDPPPLVKKVVVRDRDDRDRRGAVLGIIALALALLVIAIGFASAAGWSPGRYTIELKV